MRAVAPPDRESDPPEELVADVWRRSGGNPFLVCELSRLLLAQGGWQSGRAPAGHAEDTDDAVPDAVRDTLERRLARLSQPCAEALTAAAVAGSEVREEVLDRVVPGTPDRPALADLLAEAVDARVLVRGAEPHGRHRFSHDLYRETILSGLMPSSRRSLHLAVGRALAALRESGADVHPAEVADQLLAAGTEEAAADATRYSAAAAAEAMARLGYEEARRHYERALAAWERQSSGAPAERLDLLFGLADARFRAGDGAGARRDLHQAAELSRRLGNSEALARAAVGLHGLGARGAGPEATATTALLTAAAAQLPPDPTPLRVRVLTALVRSMRHQGLGGPPERILAAARGAVQVARAAGDPSALAHALLALHDALWQPGSGTARLPVLDEMRDAADAAGDRDLIALTHQLRAAALLESGDPSGRAELARYVALMESAGHVRGRWEAMTRRATLAAIAGRAAEADQIAVDAFDLGRAIGEADAAGVQGTLRGALLMLGTVHEDPGPDPDDLARGAPAPGYLPLLRALPMVARGDLRQAREILTGFAVDDVLVLHDLEPLALLAAVIAPAGTDQQRRLVYERLSPHTGLHVVVGGCASYWGAVDHHLGALAAGLGTREQATEHLESALAAYQRLGAPAWADRCRAALAELSTTFPPSSDRPAFRFDGGSWELAYQGRRVHVPDAKGIRDLAVLLAEPGREVHVLRLIGLEEPTGADPVLDDQARAAYRRRLAELDQEIEEGQQWQDAGRAERAALERDALIRELSAAAGLGGRARRLGDRSERARKTVTARIRDALRRIDSAHPTLATHLRATVTTGTTCSYSPESDRALGGSARRPHDP
jgi:hypothetical protein